MPVPFRNYRGYFIRVRGKRNRRRMAWPKCPPAMREVDLTERSLFSWLSLLVYEVSFTADQEKCH